MLGALGYVAAVSVGYVTARYTYRFVEPKTVDVIERGDRKVRIVRFWDVFPPSKSPKKYRAEELRAGLWLKTEVVGTDLADVKERARAMLAKGPG